LPMCRLSFPHSLPPTTPRPVLPPLSPGGSRLGGSGHAPPDGGPARVDGGRCAPRRWLVVSSVARARMRRRQRPRGGWRRVLVAPVSSTATTSSLLPPWLRHAWGGLRQVPCMDLAPLTALAADLPPSAATAADLPPSTATAGGSASTVGHDRWMCEWRAARSDGFGGAHSPSGGSGS
jgi:hypothetical protein